MPDWIKWALMSCFLGLAIFVAIYLLGEFIIKAREFGHIGQVKHETMIIAAGNPGPADIL